MILALFSLMPFLIYPHFLASLLAVSPPSTPVFIGNTLSKPNNFVMYFSYSPSTLLWKALEVNVNL